MTRHKSDWQETQGRLQRMVDKANADMAEVQKLCSTLNAERADGEPKFTVRECKAKKEESK